MFFLLLNACNDYPIPAKIYRLSLVAGSVSPGGSIAL